MTLKKLLTTTLKKIFTPPTRHNIGSEQGFSETAKLEIVDQNWSLLIVENSGGEPHQYLVRRKPITNN